MPLPAATCIGAAGNCKMTQCDFAVRGLMGNVGETLDRHSKTASAGPGKDPVSDYIVSHSDNTRCTAQQPPGPCFPEKV